MARANLANIRGQTDFQKTYYWNLSMPSPPKGGYFAGLNASDRFNMLCTTTEVPHYEGETAMQMIKGYQVPDPGIYKPVAKMTITFVEMIDSQIRGAWDNWVAACRNKESLFANLYADLILVTTDNQGLQTYQYNLLWCFPEATDPQELDSDNSNPMTFKVRLVYTDVRTVSPLAISQIDAVNRFAPG